MNCGQVSNDGLLRTKSEDSARAHEDGCIPSNDGAPSPFHEASMALSDDADPPPLPQSPPSLLAGFGGIFFFPAALFVCMKGLGLIEDRKPPRASFIPRPVATASLAPLAPVVPPAPRLTKEEVATRLYWSALAQVITDRTRSGTPLISVATNFQIQADHIRRLPSSDADPVAIRCGESVAAYFEHVARVYRYSLSGTHSMEVLAAAISGKNNGVVGNSIEMLAELTLRRSQAVSDAAAAQSALGRRFGPTFPLLPAIP